MSQASPGRESIHLLLPEGAPTSVIRHGHGAFRTAVTPPLYELPKRIVPRITLVLNGDRVATDTTTPETVVITLLQYMGQPYTFSRLEITLAIFSQTSPPSI